MVRYCQPEQRARAVGGALEMISKAPKGIVKIRFVEKQPATAWNKAAANECNFYSNVKRA